MDWIRRNSNSRSRLWGSSASILSRTAGRACAGLIAFVLSVLWFTVRGLACVERYHIRASPRIASVLDRFPDSRLYKASMNTPAGTCPLERLSHFIDHDNTSIGCRASAPCPTQDASIHVMHECNNASGLLSSALVFRSFARLIYCQPAESAGLVRGYMDDLIGRIGATIGVDRTAAEKAVGTIPQSARSWARSSVLASSSDV